MPYEVVWDTPGRVLLLRMHGDVPFESFVDIDRCINVCLQETSERLALIVDASQAKVAPYGIERIKATQTYLQSRQILQLLVVSDNRLNRLAMLLLFNACQPRLQFYDKMEQAKRFLELSQR
ncbi:MAG: hypothetical protein JNM70_14600 [Anaerolineae bacterium]|nr:hypothetical protein [Anaerolineae bacterium]